MSGLSKNRVVFERLCADGGIDVERAPLFDSAPVPLQVDVDRIEGMLFGLAIGNALGAPTEGILPADRRRQYGEIRDYLPTDRSGGRAVGLPTLDTQLSFLTLEQILSDRAFDPGNVAARFCSERLVAVGDTIRAFLKRHKDESLPWFKSGMPSAGNGAVMRIAPVLVPHVRSTGPDLWVDAALAAMTTHNDSAAISSAVAFVGLLWDALGMQDAPEPEWWTERYVELARPLETNAEYRPVNGRYVGGFTGTLADFTDLAVGEARRDDLSTSVACEKWWSGAYLLETVPSVLYILERHGDDFEEAVVRAVSDTWDNDTIGAIVGALAGALHGRSAIPQRWIENLSGRTGFQDDGRVFELVKSTAAWLSPPVPKVS